MKSLTEILRLVFSFGGEPPPSIDRRSEVPSPLPPLRTQQTTITGPSLPARPTTKERNSRAVPITTNQRIKWDAPAPVSPSSPANPKLDQTGKRIDWSGSAGNSPDSPSNLIGVEDAFEHTHILAGEQIAFCTRDKVAYHLSTWEFLVAQNQGRCCICGQSNVIKLIRLPGALAPVPVPQIPAPRPKVSILPGEQGIGLEDVFRFIGLAVIIQDFVHEVYRSRSTGTYFVRFNIRRPTDPPFAGFKLVIRPSYQSEWTAQGIRIEEYMGHYIRVRGIVQVHQDWGTEILVNSPRVIEVVEGPKSGKDSVHTIS